MATPERHSTAAQYPEEQRPEEQRPEEQRPDGSGAAVAGPYVDRAGWLANTGRLDLIDEIADSCERSVPPSRFTQSGRARFWSRESPGWPNDSPGWPSRAAS
jgi:hypothetical protein